MKRQQISDRMSNITEAMNNQVVALMDTSNLTRERASAIVRQQNPEICARYAALHNLFATTRADGDNDAPHPDDQNRLDKKDKRRKRDRDTPGDENTDRARDRGPGSDPTSDDDAPEPARTRERDDTSDTPGLGDLDDIDEVNPRYNDDSPGDGSDSDDSESPDEEAEDSLNLDPKKKEKKSMQRVTPADGQAALQKLDRLARELQRTNPRLSFAQAYEQILKENAGLYVTYLKAKQG
jgi:hypothetical protein